MEIERLPLLVGGCVVDIIGAHACELITARIPSSLP